MENLSRREREVINIIFALGEATLSQVSEAMDEPPTRPALRSILTILEEKGHLKHRQDGREFVYRSVVSREKAGRSMLERVLGTFFGGSISQALAAYLSDPKTRLTRDEIAELRRFIDETKPR